MRWAYVAATFALVFLLAPAAASQGVPDDAPVAPAVPPAVEAMLGLGGSDASGTAYAFLAQLEAQGAIPFGTITRPLAPAPPTLEYQDAHPACDVNGDGVTDLVSNRLDLTSPPSTDGARSEIQAISGKDGQLLWKQDDQGVALAGRFLDVTLDRSGTPMPLGGPNVRASVDLDGDGVCDVFAYGYDTQERTSVPVTGPRTETFLVEAKMLSGKDGKEIWKLPLSGRRVTQSERYLRSETVVRVENF